MRRIFAIGLLGSFLFLGCFGTKGLKPVSGLSPVDCGSLQYPESGGMVFRDVESWEGFWNSYCRVITGGGTRLAAPQVEFSSQMLIGVFSGQKPTGGYDVTIQRVLEGSKTIIVEYVEKSPPPDASVTMALTYPCQIIAVPRSDKSVEFKRVKK